jgi:hypothetical protein
VGPTAPGESGRRADVHHTACPGGTVSLVVPRDWAAPGGNLHPSVRHVPRNPPERKAQRSSSDVSRKAVTAALPQPVGTCSRMCEWKRAGQPGHVGSGPGALTAQLVRRLGSAAVWAIDASASFGRRSVPVSLKSRYGAGLPSGLPARCAQPLTAAQFQLPASAWSVRAHA